MAEAKIYLQVEPVWHQWRKGKDGNPEVERLKVTKVLQTRPERITGVVVELRLRIPDGAFKPLAPVVTIDVPEEALNYEPEVTIEFPGEAPHVQ